MRRPPALAVAALLALAATDAGRRQGGPPLPLPPTPPPGGPAALAAPRPNQDAEPPQGPGAAWPRVAPAWFADSHSYRPSEGFLPGSQIQAKPSGHRELAPGLEFRVPLK